MDLERVESVKAGIIGTIVGTTVSIALVSVEAGISGRLLTQAMLLHGIQRVAVAAVCSFLFGVTYRYVVRQDANPHLRSGAVGAFALTRSLSQLETRDLPEFVWTNVLSLSLPIVESFGLFLAVRLVLDLGLRQKWLKPFCIDPPVDTI